MSDKNNTELLDEEELLDEIQKEIEELQERTTHTKSMINFLIIVAFLVVFNLVLTGYLK